MSSEPTARRAELGTPEVPLRAVILGSSQAVLVRPRRTGGGGTYAEHLQHELRARGLVAGVINEGRWFEMSDHIFKRWDSAVAPRLPHVVVLHVGFVECQPWVVPHRLHRWVLAWQTSLHPLARVGRRALATPLEALMRRATPGWSRVTRQRLWKQSPTRFRGELDRLIRATRDELGALVLVVSMAPRPGAWLGDLMPDLDERMARYDGILRDAVRARGDDDVVLVDVTPIHDELGDLAAPDGIHLGPEAHQRLAARLADEVVAWRTRAA